MKECPNCRNQIPDDAAFCPVCGTAINAFHSFPEPYPPQQPISPPPVYTPPVPKINPYDHTSKFYTGDISANKLWCMVCYLMDVIGILIALMGAKDSDYTQFHIRQAVKFSIVEALLAFLALLLCWTFVVPILAAAALIVVMVLKFFAFLSVCKGKALEPALIRSMKFLK